MGNSVRKHSLQAVNCHSGCNEARIRWKQPNWLRRAFIVPYVPCPCCVSVPSPLRLRDYVAATGERYCDCSGKNWWDGIWLFKHHQSGVIDPIGFTHAVPFALVQRVDVDLARIKRLHVGEKALDPR
jgi:hypothetical protein